MAAREIPIDLELKSFSSAAQDLKLNDQQAADIKEESMPSIPTPSVLSLQEETNLDNITKTGNNKDVDSVSINHHKDNPGNKSNIMQKGNCYEDTCSVKDILKNENINENFPHHQVSQFISTINHTFLAGSKLGGS